MSRAFRIRVSESITRVIHVDDGICAPLDLLPVLPRERMDALLAQELERRGFELDGATARRDEGDGVVIEVDIETRQVSLSVAEDREVEEVATASAIPDKSEDQGRAKLERAVQEQLETALDERQEKLRVKATERLERKLGDLRAELDGVINRVTAEALKERAGQLGEVEEVHEDLETGSLTIKVKL